MVELWSNYGRPDGFSTSLAVSWGNAGGRGLGGGQRKGKGGVYSLLFPAFALLIECVLVSALVMPCLALPCQSLLLSCNVKINHIFQLHKVSACHFLKPILVRSLLELTTSV